MNKLKSWFTLILAIIALGLIGWNYTNNTEFGDGEIVDDGQPTYQSKSSISFVYEPTGILGYKLVADDVKNYAQQKFTWFTNPVLTTYSPTGDATWTVRANKAKLTNSKMLYLYGDVQIDSLSDDSQLQRISTDNAVANLDTQDVSSDDEVTIIGVGLKSVGLKMRGNLREKRAELIEKVNTYYEIPNESKIRNTLIIGTLLAISVPAMALKDDTQQPIVVNSEKQSLDLEKNVTTFTQNVVIKQGSIDIRADKVIVTRPGGDSKKIVIEAFGNPVTFYQLQDDGKPIKGRGEKMTYEMDKELMTLTGKAYLEQLDSNITGDKITYLVPTQQMEAFSGKGKQVTTVLLPSQLQEKGPGVNNKGK